MVEPVTVTMNTSNYLKIPRFNVWIVSAMQLLQYTNPSNFASRPLKTLCDFLKLDQSGAPLGCLVLLTACIGSGRTVLLLGLDSFKEKKRFALCFDFFFQNQYTSI
jgi:hypothetical protein